MSVTGTAPTFDTANIAVSKLDNISQGSYPTMERARVVGERTLVISHITERALFV